MNNEEIKSCVMQLICNQTKTDIGNNIDEIPLTSVKIGLSSIDITYLFFRIEKEFAIRIDTDKILNYEFNTIKGISNIVSECLAHKGEK